MPPEESDDDDGSPIEVTGSYSIDTSSFSVSVDTDNPQYRVSNEALRAAQDHFVDQHRERLRTVGNRLGETRDSEQVGENIFEQIAASLQTGRDELNTRDSVKMDYNSLETWFVEKAHDLFPVGRIGHGMAGGGFPRIRQWVLEQKSEDVESEYEETGDYIRAFNNVTMQWPHDARAYLAAYQYEHTGFGNETYREKLEEFANAVGVLDYETMQSELTWFYGDNPYHDPELTDAEAKAVMILRANDVDESLLEDVENAENFIGWYEDTGDAEGSVRACQFDSSLPEQLALQLKEPSAWGELDPSDIHSGSCAICGGHFYHVEHVDHDEAWVSSNGDTVESTNKFANDNCAFSMPEGDADLLCDDCISAWEDNERRVTVFDGEHTFSLGRNRGIICDYGRKDDADFDSPYNVDRIIAEMCETALDGIPEECFELTPTNRAGSAVHAQERVLQEAAESPDDVFDNGVIYIAQIPQFDGESYAMYIPRTNPDVAQEAKELLEDADETELIA